MPRILVSYTHNFQDSLDLFSTLSCSTKKENCYTRRLAITKAILLNLIKWIKTKTEEKHEEVELKKKSFCSHICKLRNNNLNRIKRIL